MNAGIYKLIFSKRLNALVVVGEICSSQGKAPGTTRALKRSTKGMVQVMRILALFSSGGLLVSTAWATPAPDALPTGGQVAQGSASISQSGAQMDINQASHRAVINWQTFDVGANAKVHIVQPDQAAVLLNRVVTNKPSEIYGKIDANGQVILVNNNGIVFGKDGSASASSFTATTLDISDKDFMDGKDRFSSNGSHGEIVNHGTIEAKNGGYVALLGAKVTNDGKIITHNGTVALGAADSIAIPMTSSGKIKMELSAASVNAAVENTKDGVIVTEGGDVYLQAAAANNAMASIKHSGQIDTSGEQAGKAILLADSGEITVDGSVIANSTNVANKGGDIIIGRDQQTGVLAKSSNVSGARLESKKGFVETSGHDLKIDGAQVGAANWLLDPDNIQITDGAAGVGYSAISATTLASALTSGTNITVNTTAVNGTTYNNSVGNGGTGKILVTSAISKSSAGDATLNLIADDSITLNNNITSSGVGAGKLNINLTAKTGNVSGAGNLNANGGTLTVNSAIGEVDESVFTGSAAASAPIGTGVLSGSIQAANLIKKGVGTIKLSGNNTIGAMTISQGSILIGNGGGDYSKAAGSSTSTITLGDSDTGSNNVGLYLEGNVANTNFSNKIIVNNYGNKVAIGGLNAGVYTQYNGELILNRDIYLYDGTNDRIGMDAKITGVGNITITGNRTTMSKVGDLSYTGNVTVNQGAILQANAANIFRSKTSLEVNGTMKLMSGSNQSIDKLSGNGTITSWKAFGSTPATLSVGNNDGTSTFSGVIAAGDFAINLEKNGTGTQILTGANTYTGTTTINGGTLQVGNGSSTGQLGTGVVTLNNAVNLKYLRSTNTVIANAISGTGNVYANISAGDLTVNKAINLTAGNIYLQASGAISNVASATLSGTNISLDNSKGIIDAGTGAITKGIGTGSSTVNGVDIRANITASGNLNLNGSSSSATGLGIYLNSSSSLSAGGNIKATGTSATYIGGQFQGTVTATGDINLEGYSSGTASQGLIVQNAVQSNSGNITVTGQTTSNNAAKPAVAITVNGATNGSLKTLATNKAININANTLLINNSPSPGSFVNAGNTGTVNIKTLTAGNEILIGGADVANGTLSSQKLGIDSNELNLITAANLVIGDTSSTGKITVSNAITTNATTGNLTLQTGGDIAVNAALTVGGAGATKNLTLNGTSSQTAAIKADGLQLLGANALHTLINTGNHVATLAADTKTINYLNDSALTLGAVNTTGINATGDVSIATQTGDLTIAENVATSATALILNAGKSANVGAAVGTDNIGNIKVNTGKTVSVGSNGIAQLMTGSITGNTTAAALASAGHFRYNSDETNTNYNTALGSGVNVIYREKPTLSVNVNNAIKTYDGVAYSGGNGFTESTPTGLQNNDTLANSTATALFGGSAQNAKNAATYILSASETGKNALGYEVTYNSGILLINKKEVSLSASRDYSGSKALNNVEIDTGVTVNGIKETLTYANALAKYKDVTDANGDNQANANYVDSISFQNAIDGSGGLADNYTFISANSLNNSVTINAKELALSASRDYNGSKILNNVVIDTGVTVNGSKETLTYAHALAKYKDVTDANADNQGNANYVDSITLQNGTGNAYNYRFTNINSANNNVTINAKQVALSASRDYNGGKTLNNVVIDTGVTVNGSKETLTYADVLAKYKDVTDANADNQGNANYVDSITLQNGTGNAYNYRFTNINSANNNVTINAKQVALSATKTYDGNTHLTGNQLSIDTGIGTETLTYSNATINSKDVKDNVSNYVKTVTLANGTGKASNYQFTAVRSANNQVMLDKANAIVIANSATVKYSGEYQTVSGFTATGLVAGETEQVLTGVSAKRTEKEVGSYTTIATGSDSNYNLNFVRGQFLINSVNPVVNPAQTINPAQSNSSSEAASTAGGSSSSGGGKVAISATPAPMPNQIDNTAKQCSIAHPEACEDQCQDALMPGVVFCLVAATPTTLSHKSI